MEKAVLKTLAYYDLFNFPLKAWEIHKWLIGKRASLSQTEKIIKKIEKKSQIKTKKGYWYFTGRDKLVKIRQVKEAVSTEHLLLAKRFAWIVRVMPWIKMIGVSGSLAMMGSRKTDDVDLFVVTASNRIWLSRLFLIILTTFLGKRRSRREKLLSAAGKICINLILEEDNLEQKKRNIYVAHEVLQMRPLWQKNEIYSNFLHINSWAFKYLPNWRSNQKMDKTKWHSENRKKRVRSDILIDGLENLAKILQLKIMKKPTGQERIESGALYFHPEDKGIKVLEEYYKRTSSLRRQGSNQK